MGTTVSTTPIWRLHATPWGLYFNTSDKFEKHRQLRVLVWDWTTSELILDFSDSHSLNQSLPFEKTGFGLLDSTYCSFTSALYPGSIQLYEHARSSMSDPPAVHHLATLQLPGTIPLIAISRIYAHAGPIEAHPLPRTPSTVIDDDRLHVFTIEYAYIDGWQTKTMGTNLFMHQRVFTKYCMQQKQGAQVGDTPLEIPWEAWGPSNTRIVFPFCTSLDAASLSIVSYVQMTLHTYCVQPTPSQSSTSLANASIPVVFREIGSLAATKYDFSFASPSLRG
ncbi:hypothetical protein BJ912DRAFT_1064493 [Pholiota molesta]|nr:hypothetical protein BJ912DRAFT_1064493 [Pholiota molesta]